MKYILIFGTCLCMSTLFAQSKKEQIAVLNLRLDSLTREYIKDTTELTTAKRSLEKEVLVLKDKNESAQVQLKKKSQVIRDKTTTIKTLNASNLELMQERKELNQTILILQSQMKAFKDSIRNDMYLFSLSNGARDMYMGEGQKLPVAVEIGLYINERFYIVETFDDVAFPTRGEEFEAEPSIMYKFKKGYKEGMGIGFNPDHQGWKSIELVTIDNMPFIVEIDGGGNMETVILRKINFDRNNNLNLTEIFKADIEFGTDNGSLINCYSGDCDYKNYLKERYSD